MPQPYTTATCSRAVNTAGPNTGTARVPNFKYFWLGLVSDEGKETLAAAIEAGHAAMHRGFVANPGQLKVVIDIIENLLLNIYVLPKRSKHLKAGIPPRAVKK